MISTRSVCELFQIANVKSLDVCYPFCEFCYKKVTFQSKYNSFVCNPCNETFHDVQYRYRINMDVTNLSKLLSVSLFGKSLDHLFGVDCNTFVKYREKTSRVENWNECLSLAFRFCLIDRWFEFEFDKVPMRTAQKQQQQQQSIVARRIAIPKIEKPSFLSIYQYLSTARHFHADLNFSIFDVSDNDEDEDSASIINETIDHSQQKTPEDNNDLSPLTKGLKSISINY